MSTFDGVNNEKFVQSLVPQAVSGAVNGTGVDTQGFEEVTLVGFGDGTAEGELRLEESSDNVSFTAVAASDCIGTNPSGSDNITTAVTAVKIGYIGQQRYVRAAWAVNTSSGDVQASIKLGAARIAPVSGDA